jgi:hypothetical protein
MWRLFSKPLSPTSNGSADIRFKQAASRVHFARTMHAIADLLYPMLWRHSAHMDLRIVSQVHLAI